MKFVYLILLVTVLAAYLRIVILIATKCDPICPIVGWLAGLGYFILAPLAIITVQGGYELPEMYEVGSYWGAVDLSTSRFFLPYFTIWLSVMGAFAVVYMFLSPPRSVSWRKHINIQRLEKGIATTVAISVINWAILIWLLGGLSEFLISHWYDRTEELVARHGDLFVLSLHLSGANQVVFVSLAVLHAVICIQRNEIRWRAMGYVLSALLLEVVVSGNRIYLAIYLLGVIATLCFAKRWRLLLALLASAPVMVLVFSMWSSIRGNLSQLGDAAGMYIDSENSRDVSSSAINVTEGMNVLLLMHIIDDYGNRFDYLKGVTYSRAIISFMPRRLFPDKPKNFTALMAEQYLPNVETSLNATAIGEMYANFGPFTLLLFPVVTGAIVMLNNRGSRAVHHRPLISTVLFVLLVWGARSTLEDNFLTFVFCMLLIRLFRFESGLTTDAALPA